MTSDPAPSTCDRCMSMPATETVKCWYGCEHRECSRCAKQTAKEAADR